MTDKQANLRFDHAIILVKNLKKAVRNYQQLGFHVVPGGELKGGAQNAVIPFEDGTYLELFSVGGFLLMLAKMFKTIFDYGPHVQKLEGSYGGGWQARERK